MPNPTDNAFSDSHQGIENSSSGSSANSNLPSDLTTLKVAAIALRRAPDNQGYEIWVIYPNPSYAAGIPPRRSMLMAMSREVTLALARQVAHMVAQNYGLRGFREES